MIAALAPAAGALAGVAFLWLLGLSAIQRPAPADDLADFFAELAAAPVPRRALVRDTGTGWPTRPASTPPRYPLSTKERTCVYIGH
jgi:hypothetical protein